MRYSPWHVKKWRGWLYLPYSSPTESYILHTSFIKSNVWKSSDTVDPTITVHSGSRRERSRTWSHRTENRAQHPTHIPRISRSVFPWLCTPAGCHAVSLTLASRAALQAPHPLPRSAIVSLNPVAVGCPPYRCRHSTPSPPAFPTAKTSPSSPASSVLSTSATKPPWSAATRPLGCLPRSLSWPPPNRPARPWLLALLLQNCEKVRMAWFQFTLFFMTYTWPLFSSHWGSIGIAFQTNTCLLFYVSFLFSFITIPILMSRGANLIEKSQLKSFAKSAAMLRHRQMKQFQILGSTRICQLNTAVPRGHFYWIWASTTTNLFANLICPFER